jgi:hypothetical protein
MAMLGSFHQRVRAAVMPLTLAQVHALCLGIATVLGPEAQAEARHADFHAEIIGAIHEMTVK